jgi:sugar diacid utilization regulator
LASAEFRLTPGVAKRLSAGLPDVAQRVVAAVVSEVPSYADPFRRGMGRQIETAVRVALDGFLDLASGTGSRSRRTQHQRVHDAAYALGQGEARAGRSIDALTTAYGVGARVAWRDMGSGAIDAGMPATEVAQFAELVFAYINELSVRSINGHAEELASSGQVRQRRLERLCRKLIDGAYEDELDAAAGLADWDPPRDLTAVLLPEHHATAVAFVLDRRSLQPGEDLAELPSELTVLLVPSGSARDRAALLRTLGSIPVVVGPSRPWVQARASYERAVRASQLEVAHASEPLDTDAHLLEIVLGADAGALADLRAQVLAPFETVSAASRDKLAATLRAWLLHQGRRDDVARALFVHPQTVRYRMGQLRDLFGDQLADPRFVLELTVALA